MAVGFRGANEGNDELESVSIKDTEFEATSDQSSALSETEKHMTAQTRAMHGSHDEKNEKMIKYMTMNEEKFEHFNNKITAIEKDLADIKQMLEYKSIKHKIP